MAPISEDELEGMLPGRKRHRGLGLATAKVNVLLVFWQRDIQSKEVFHVLIDEKVMVAGRTGFQVNPGWGYAHSLQSEHDGEFAFDRFPIFRCNDVAFGIFRRRCDHRPGRGCCGIFGAVGHSRFLGVFGKSWREEDRQSRNQKDRGFFHNWFEHTNTRKARNFQFLIFGDWLGFLREAVSEVRSGENAVRNGCEVRF